MEIVFARFSQSRTGESEESKGAKMATEEEEDELYASVRTTALEPPDQPNCGTLTSGLFFSFFFLFFSFTARSCPNKRSRRFRRKRLAKTRRALSQPRRRMIRVPGRVTPRPPCP